MVTHLDDVIQCEFIRVTNKRNPILHAYYIENTLIKEVLSATYLGVTIDSKLTWNDHIQRIVNKSSYPNRCLSTQKSTSLPKSC